MPTRLACLIAVCVLACQACVRIDRRSSNPVPGDLLAAVAGHWQGTWSSARIGSGGQSAGTLQLTVQQFGQHPVVQFTTDNPCLPPRSYLLSLEAGGLELRSGDILFLGSFGGEHRTLAGTYRCDTDDGDWQAVWVTAADPVGDVTGNWLGVFESQEPPVGGGIALRLEQFWEAGSLRVRGEVDFLGQSVGGSPSLMQVTDGRASWQDGRFQVRLVTDQQQEAILILMGDGPAGELLVQGQMLLGSPGGTRANGPWRATRIDDPGR